MQSPASREGALLRLRVSIVSFHSDEQGLARSIESLAAACHVAGDMLRHPTSLVLVDNSHLGRDATRLQALIERLSPSIGNLLDVSLLVAGRNLGYGRANNLAQALPADEPQHDFVLVLNPDVDIDRDAIRAALTHLARTPDSVLVVPRARNREGEDLWLAHRYPSPLLFALRGGLLPWLRHRLASALEHYEIRDLPPDHPHRETICASGCFMLMRGRAWRQTGGFDERFFVYFEDYDLSARMRAIGPIDYRPEVGICHLGGGAARKGGRHARLFITSACRFFLKHGWFAQRDSSGSASAGIEAKPEGNAK